MSSTLPPVASAAELDALRADPTRWVPAVEGLLRELAADLADPARIERFVALSVLHRWNDSPGWRGGRPMPCARWRR